MSNHELVLNVGDRVRNINKTSKRRGLVGVVIGFGSHDFLEEDTYSVKFSNGETQGYLKSNAYKFLEKIVETAPACGCIHDELCAKCTRQVIKAVTFFQRYGSPSQPGRQVLKKVRRNVITGKTQDDFVRELGQARGVQQFNTRALGTTTGQAFKVIGDAMCNPGTEIRISKIDHAKGNELCRTPWTTLDKHFRQVVQDLIGERKGFTFTPTHIVFNPIVTEETYVTRSN